MLLFLLRSFKIKRISSRFLLDHLKSRNHQPKPYTNTNIYDEYAVTYPQALAEEHADCQSQMGFDIFFSIFLMQKEDQ